MANVTHIDRKCFFLYLDTLAVHKVAFSLYISIAMNLFMAPLATLFNSVVLYSIWRNKALHTPSYILICSLALSDFLVGAVVQPLFVAYKFAELNVQFSDYCVTSVLALGFSYIFGGASFFTITAISIDRYLALHLGMRYRSTVTTPRVTKVIITIWVFSCILSSMQLFLNRKIFFRVVVVVMVLCLVVTAGAYIKSFKALKRHQARIGTRNMPNPSEYSARDITKYRETLIVILYIVLLVLFWYIPFLCSSVAAAVKGFTSEVQAASNIATPISFANSFLNPIVYYWKLKDIRQACVNAVRKVLNRTEISSSTTEASAQGGTGYEGQAFPKTEV